MLSFWQFILQTKRKICWSACSKLNSIWSVELLRVVVFTSDQTLFHIKCTKMYSIQICIFYKTAENLCLLNDFKSSFFVVFIHFFQLVGVVLILKWHVLNWIRFKIYLQTLSRCFWGVRLLYWPYHSSENYQS